MDKETLSHYGWIVILVLVLSVMIALATPFGEYVQAGVESTLVGLNETKNVAFEIVQPPSSFVAPSKYGYEIPIKAPDYFAEDLDDLMLTITNLTGGTYSPVGRQSVFPDQIVTFKTDLFKTTANNDTIYAKLCYNNGLEDIIELTKDGTNDEPDYSDYCDHLFINLKMSDLSLPTGTSSIKATATAIIEDFTTEYDLMYMMDDGIEGWVYQNEDEDCAVMVVKNVKTEIDEDGWAGDITPEEGSVVVAIIGGFNGEIPFHKVSVAGKEFILNEKIVSDENSSVTEGVWSYTTNYTRTDKSNKQTLSLYYNAKTDGTSYETSAGNCAFVWKSSNEDATGTLVDGLESIELLGTKFEKPFYGVSKSLKNGWIFTPQLIHIFNLTSLYAKKENVNKCILSFADSSQIEFNGTLYNSENIPTLDSGFLNREYGKEEKGQIYQVELTNDGLSIINDFNAPDLVYITIHETVNGRNIETTFQLITPNTAGNLIEIPQGIGDTHQTFVREVFYPEKGIVEVSVSNQYSDGKMMNWSSPGAQAPNFNGCILKYTPATTVIIKEGITSIGYNTEWSNSITDIYLPNSLQLIPTNRYGNINLPKSVTYHVYKGSYAETLLTQNGFTCELVQ